MREMAIERFSGDLSLRYLEEGFKGHGWSFLPTSYRIVDALDGIVGWPLELGCWYVNERPEGLRGLKKALRCSGKKLQGSSRCLRCSIAPPGIP